ncbi:MAG TPA: ATP-binding cassette domain-containing protein [Gaiellaceae bacterium]|nr:ATP-binding cassette domain-containing protein [Gaiellaceae bacterium]
MTAALDVHLTGVVHLYPSPEGDVVALRGVDLDIRAGESVALLGPSGAGKSTVLGLLAGEFRPSAGSVRIGDVDVARGGSEALAALRSRDVSLVVQGADANLLPYATGLQNVWFAQHGARRRGQAPEKTAAELLDLFGLGALADRPADRLSSGERQQLALVAGVASLPRLLLLDEPTSQLTDAERDEMIDAVVAVHRTLGMTVIVVTHDTDVAARLERTVTIRDGRVGAEGRAGTEYAVVGRDGSVHLPPDVLGVLPPDSLVRVTRLDDGVELRRVDEDGDAP